MMWQLITKIIDSPHIQNHVDPPCRVNYNPAEIKERFPEYNTMAVEQTFVWLSRYKRITNSIGKTHQLFFIHQQVERAETSTQRGATNWDPNPCFQVLDGRHHCCKHRSQRGYINSILHSCKYCVARPQLIYSIFASSNPCFRVIETMVG